MGILSGSFIHRPLFIGQPGHENRYWEITVLAVLKCSCGDDTIHVLPCAYVNGLRNKPVTLSDYRGIPISQTMQFNDLLWTFL